MENIYKGLVTHVIDPSYFWMRICYSVDFVDFDEYEKTLDKFCEENEKDVVVKGYISEGDRVMIKSFSKRSQASKPQHWQRAQVICVNEDTVDAFFIDYGHTAIVTFDQVQTINEKLFDFLPAQAMRVGLAGIKPLTRLWTTRAVAFFESQVLFKDVVVSLGCDDAGALKEVLIYVKSDLDEAWKSLTNEMAANEFGLLTGPNHPLVLSLQEVENALERPEELQIESPYEDPEVPPLQQDFNSNESKICQISEQLLPSPADFMVLTHSEDTSVVQSPTKGSRFDITLKEHEFISPINVPKFDFESLKQTKSISLCKMQEDIEFEKRQNQKVKLEQEIARCEDGHHKKNTIDWGRSDLHIGKANLFSDVHEDISREIRKNLPCTLDEEELKDFFHADAQEIVNEQKLDVPVACLSASECNFLIEKEAYDLQKSIKEILRSSTEGMEVTCAMINIVVEPCVDISHDKLSTVISAILEMLICEYNVDDTLAFFVLGTYSDSKEFKDAILETLKQLKDRFVKVSQTVRCSGHHKSFSEVLATIFIWVEVLPSSICSEIQKYAVTLMERWIIFNKQRKQDQESSHNVEIMYLECVDVFMTRTQSILVDKFPDHYAKIIVEMKEKLLHQLTSRSVRSLLLDLLLRLHSGNLPLPQAIKPTTVDSATQTHDGSNQTRNKTTAPLFIPPNVETAGHPVHIDQSIYYPKTSLTSSSYKLSSDSLALSHASEFEDKKNLVLNSMSAGGKMEKSQLSNESCEKLFKGETDEIGHEKNQNSEPHEFKGSRESNSTSDSDSKEVSTTSVSQRSSVEISTANKFLPEPPSNTVKWKSLSELLPQGSLWPQKASHASTSVDPEFYNIKSPLNEPQIQCLKANLTGESEQTCDYEQNQGKIPPVPEWPEQFFTSADVVSSASEETFNIQTSQQHSRVKQGKKKKTKFVPLTNYVKSAQSSHVEYSSETGHDDNVVYQEEVLTGETREKRKIIHPSRLGALAGSCSPRKSLFADLRMQTSTNTESRIWIPGKVVCSSCKKEGHLIYDCPNDGDYLTNRDDEQYLLL